MKLFGKTIGTTVIIALLMATSMAATVLYLSDEASSNVSVNAPFEVKMSETGEGGWKDVITLDDRYGGESSTFWIRYENLAEQDINMEIISTIICADELGGDRLLVSEEDFRNDSSSIDPILYGVTVNGSLYTELGIKTDSFDIVGINEEDEDDKRPRVLVLETFSSDDVLEKDFPAGNYTIIEMTLHHAPTSYGTYTITSQAFDPYMIENEE